MLLTLLLLTLLLVTKKLVVGFVDKNFCYLIEALTALLLLLSLPVLAGAISTMVGCAAIGCSNHTSQGFLMKTFPPVRKKQWTDQVNGRDCEPTNYSRLCEVHFAPETWEKPRVDGKRILRKNPTQASQ